MTPKCKILKRFFFSQVVKIVKIKRKLSKSSSGVTAVYVDVNQWVYAFFRIFFKNNGN